MHTEHLSAQQIERAADFLKNGKLVAFPTETVYGLGASAFDAAAIEKIFHVKGRAADNPLIVHISDWDQLKEVALAPPPLFFPLAEHFFPGPLTIILERHPNIPAIASAGLSTVAVRMPAHPVARDLIAAAQLPLVAPSANLSGKPSATSAAHVREDFEGKIDAILDAGSTEIGIESTVVHLIGGEVFLLRPGAVTQEALESVLGKRIFVPTQTPGEVVHSPGMKYRHYSPNGDVRVFLEAHTLFEKIDQSNQQKKIMVLSRQPLEGIPHFLLSAKELYAHLRTADREHYTEVWILCDEEVRADVGLMNRIDRASLPK